MEITKETSQSFIKLFNTFDLDASSIDRFQASSFSNFSDLERPSFLRVRNNEFTVSQRNLQANENFQSQLPRMYDLNEEAEINKLPTLTHITSFEKNTLEDYGKQLRRIFLQYRKQKNQTLQLKNNEELEHLNAHQQVDLRQVINRNENLCENQKMLFVQKMTKDIQFEIILNQIIKGIPKEQMFEALYIYSIIAQTYDDHMRNKKLQHLKNTFQLYQKDIIAKSVVKRMDQEKIVNTTERTKFRVQNWLIPVFKGLSGVYQIEKRPRTFNGDEQFDFDNSGLMLRKLIKNY